MHLNRSATPFDCLEHFTLPRAAVLFMLTGSRLTIFFSIFYSVISRDQTPNSTLLSIYWSAYSWYSVLITPVSQDNYIFLAYYIVHVGLSEIAHLDKKIDFKLTAIF